VRATLDFMGFIKVIEMNSLPPRIKVPLFSPALLKEAPIKGTYVEYMVFRCVCSLGDEGAYYMWSGNER